VAHVTSSQILASTSRTDAANHLPPRAVGIPRSLSALAMARNEVAPLACSSVISDARSAARRGDLRILESLSDLKKGPIPAGPGGLVTLLEAQAASRRLTRATCVACHRPPLGAGTPRRVNSSAAARTDSADTLSNTPRSSLARSSAAWAFTSLCSRRPPSGQAYRSARRPWSRPWSDRVPSAARARRGQQRRPLCRRGVVDGLAANFCRRAPAGQSPLVAQIPESGIGNLRPPANQ
jgi:hypothetical protein